MYDKITPDLRPISWMVAASTVAATQTTDVEDEVNGYVTSDREVEKMDFVKVRAVHRGFWI
jgi:hypothetical protein